MLSKHRNGKIIDPGFSATYLVPRGVEWSYARQAADGACEGETWWYVHRLDNRSLRSYCISCSYFVLHEPENSALWPSVLTSYTPVEAPLGTEALNMPSSVYMSTSTVGFPRESMISRPTTLEMVDYPMRDGVVLDIPTRSRNGDGCNPYHTD